MPAVREMFDLRPQGSHGRTLVARLPIPEETGVGLIVGPSGSGKTLIARKAFPTANWCQGDATDPGDGRSVMAWLEAQDVDTATRLLGAVGLHSVPAWIRRLSHLSTGEQFRARVAKSLVRCMREGSRLCVVDEFCSVVDVHTMRSISTCLGKAFRNGLVQGQFVGITCRPDVAKYLCPDWVLTMPEGRLGGVDRSTPRKPDFRLVKASRNDWSCFREHHYLSRSLSPYSSCWMGLCHREPVAFAAVLPVSGKNQSHKRRVSRLVVLPSFQGRGFARRMMHALAKHYEREGLLLTITTSHPAMIGSLVKGNHWKQTNRLPAGKIQGGFTKRGLKRETLKHGRMVTTLEWAGGYFCW